MIKRQNVTEWLG